MNSDREQSEFNMAVSYLNRLNALFYLCDQSAMELNAHSWFHSLNALFRELSTEMKQDEVELFNGVRDTINSQLNNASTSRLKPNNQELSTELYNLLHDYELKIRGVLKSAGLQSKMVDDAAKALK